LNDELTLRQDVAEASLTVLLVEDEILTRLATAEYLRASGYRVIEAANVVEALGVFGSGINVDFVFTDINMPGEHDGHAFAGWLTQHHPNIPLLLTSGSPEELNKAGARDGQRIIPKPYSLGDVEKIIKAVIG
jgi:CheY-like chemotaxis protein